MYIHAFIFDTSVLSIFVVYLDCKGFLETVASYSMPLHA